MPGLCPTYTLYMLKPEAPTPEACGVALDLPNPTGGRSKRRGTLSALASLFGGVWGLGFSFFFFLWGGGVEGGGFGFGVNVNAGP